jgi:hypothetical protein
MSEEGFDVTQAYRKLEKQRRSIRMTPEELEEQKRDAMAYYKAIPMYDWGSGEVSNEHDMNQKYGSRYVNALWDCELHAKRVPKKLISDLHRIHEGKKPYGKNTHQRDAQQEREQRRQPIDWDRLEKKQDLEPTTYTSEHYTTVRAGMINTVRQCKVLRNPTALLFYLLQHKPWEGKKDKHDTYGYWYVKKHLIVASVSVEKMAADLGVHEKTVRNWIEELHESGIIKKVKIGLENIYVLGEVTDTGEKYYYAGEIPWQ